MSIEPATKAMLHDAFGAQHAWTAYMLYAPLVTLHIAGALKHQFMDGEPEVQRILP